MGSIKPFFPLLLIMTALGMPLTAQSAGGAGLVTEIQNIERTVNRPGVSGTERHEALIRLARIQRLAGNWEAAARAWIEAALTEPDKQDYTAFLEGAQSLMALGEYDQARASVNAVLANGTDRELLIRARYIAALLEAFSGGRFGDLAKLLEESDYREYRPALYYTLWRISGDPAYRTRLLAEYPASPEGRIAAEDSDSIGPAPSALWFLFPGRESVTLGPPVPAEALTVIPAPSSGSLLPPVTTELPELTGAKAASPAAPLAGPSALQTGLFSREENAHATVQRLNAAGFSATTSRRRVNGVDYWVVSVPPGPDSQQTIMRLKDAGFEAFPVF